MSFEHLGNTLSKIWDISHISWVDGHGLQVPRQIIREDLRLIFMTPGDDVRVPVVLVISGHKHNVCNERRTRTVRSNNNSLLAFALPNYLKHLLTDLNLSTFLNFQKKLGKLRCMQCKNI